MGNLPGKANYDSAYTLLYVSIKFNESPLLPVIAFIQCF